MEVLTQGLDLDTVREGLLAKGGHTDLALAYAGRVSIGDSSPFTVEELMAISGAGRPAISRQTALLRDMEVLERQRGEGKYVTFAAAGPAYSPLLNVYGDVLRATTTPDLPRIEDIAEISAEVGAQVCKKVFGVAVRPRIGMWLHELPTDRPFYAAELQKAGVPGTHPLSLMRAMNDFKNLGLIEFDGISDTELHQMLYTRTNSPLWSVFGTLRRAIPDEAQSPRDLVAQL